VAFAHLQRVEVAEQLVVRFFVDDDVRGRMQGHQAAGAVFAGQAQRGHLRHRAADAEYRRLEAEQAGDLALERLDQRAAAVDVVGDVVLFAPGGHGGKHLRRRARAVAGEDGAAGSQQFGVGHANPG
jgi:hypothetical protein